MRQELHQILQCDLGFGFCRGQRYVDQRAWTGDNNIPGTHELTRITEQLRGVVLKILLAECLHRVLNGHCRTGLARIWLWPRSSIYVVKQFTDQC